VPSIADLCQDYAARSHPEKALKDPVFHPLVAAAGSEDKVAGYCTAHAKKPRETNKPGDKGKPVDPGKPADPGRPDDRPAGEPKKPGDNGKTTTRAPRNTGAGQTVTPRRP
jgi:hypothetical protein